MLFTLTLTCSVMCLFPQRYYKSLFDIFRTSFRQILTATALRQYRTKPACRLCAASADEFSVISHRNSLQYASIPASFLCNLTKNLLAHLLHDLCAVLPCLDTLLLCIIAYARWLCKQKQEPVYNRLLFSVYLLMIWEITSRILSWQPPQPVEQWVIFCTSSNALSTFSNRVSRCRAFSTSA